MESAYPGRYTIDAWLREHPQHNIDIRLTEIWDHGVKLPDGKWISREQWAMMSAQNVAASNP